MTIAPMHAIYFEPGVCVRCGEKCGEDERYCGRVCNAEDLLEVDGVIRVFVPKPVEKPVEFITISFTTDTSLLDEDGDVDPPR